MAITYYKRFRMEIDLDGPLQTLALPPQFSWVSWDESLLEQHAEVKFLAFHEEIDSHVFPCLGDRHGLRVGALADIERVAREPLIRSALGDAPFGPGAARERLGALGAQQLIAGMGATRTAALATLSTRELPQNRVT